MRKSIITVILSGFLLAGIIINSCSLPAGSQSVRQRNVVDVAGKILSSERNLELSAHVKDSIEGKKEIDTCRYYFKIVNNSMNKLADVVKSTELLDLMNVVLSHSTACGGVDFVTALKIYYGVESGELKLFYQPLLLCLQSEGYNQDSELIGIFNYTYEGDVYEYLPGGFSLANQNTAHANYLNQIRVIGTATGTVYNPHNQKATIDGDVTSIIFPFQEFVALIEDNQWPDSLRIYNAIRQIKHGNETYIKHALLFSANNTNLLHSFTRKYANFAHLCPPSCSGNVGYRLRVVF
jgi:hypothetical protein